MVSFARIPVELGVEKVSAPALGRRVALMAGAALTILAVSACSGRELSNRDKGILGGAAIGSGLGAIVGHSVGSTGAGIAIGGAAGALGGGLIGNEQDNVDDRQTDQDERMRRQEEELRRQRREIEELRRQQGYDGSRSNTGHYDDDRYDNDRYPR